MEAAATNEALSALVHLSQAATAVGAVYGVGARAIPHACVRNHADPYHSVGSTSSN